MDVAIENSDCHDDAEVLEKMRGRGDWRQRRAG
jgi:hypothetical protein